MSSLFQDVLNDAQGVEDKLLGPSYPYYKNIKMPSEIGMSDDGSLSALGKDINGLIQYVEVLVTGNSNASSTGGPLGNKFFLQTGAKCNDVKTNQEVDRYIYVNNVPQGNIPFISQGLGVNFSEFKGLIPGSMGNLNVLNPFAIMSSFLSGSTPDCQEITMETVDVNNNKSSESHFVTLVDIKNMDPCNFPDKKNPATNASCKETFTQLKNSNGTPFEFSTKLPVTIVTDAPLERPITNLQGYKTYQRENQLPTDPLVQLYYLSLAMISVYLLYRIMEKSR